MKYVLLAEPVPKKHIGRPGVPQGTFSCPYGAIHLVCPKGARAQAAVGGGKVPLG